MHDIIFFNFLSISDFLWLFASSKKSKNIYQDIRDLKYRQRNGRRRRFSTEADLGQGFRFRRGKRSLSSAASQTDDDFFFAKNFVMLQLVMAFKDLRNLHLISLMTMANLLFFTTWIIRLWRLSLRRTAFVFVLKLKVSTDLEQLLTCSYAKLRLLKRIQCCFNVLQYLSSLRDPHSHIMFQSPMKHSFLYYRLKTT